MQTIKFERICKISRKSTLIQSSYNPCSLCYQAPPGGEGGVEFGLPPSPPHQLDSNHDDATILSWTLALLYLEDILGRAIRM